MVKQITEFPILGSAYELDSVSVNVMIRSGIGRALKVELTLKLNIQLFWNEQTGTQTFHLNRVTQKLLFVTRHIHVRILICYTRLNTYLYVQQSHTLSN